MDKDLQAQLRAAGYEGKLDLTSLIKVTRLQQLKRDPIVGWYADYVIGKTPAEALGRLLLDQHTSRS